MYFCNLIQWATTLYGISEFAQVTVVVGCAFVICSRSSAITCCQLLVVCCHPLSVVRCWQGRGQVWQAGRCMELRQDGTLNEGECTRGIPSVNREKRKHRTHQVVQQQGQGRLAPMLTRTMWKGVGGSVDGYHGLEGCLASPHRGCP